MKTYRLQVLLDVLIEADSEQDARDQFMEVDLGALDKERGSGEIFDWDYVDVLEIDES